MRRDYNYTRSKSDRPPAKRPKSRIKQTYYNLKRWVFRRKHPYSKLRSDELVINLGLAIGLSIILLIILSYSDTLNSIAIWFVELGTVIALILLYFIIKKLYKVFVNLKYGVRGLTNGVKIISIVLLILLSWQIYQNHDDFDSFDSFFNDDFFNTFSIEEITVKTVESTIPQSYLAYERLEECEKRIFDKTNAERKTHCLEELTWDSKLQM